MAATAAVASVALVAAGCGRASTSSNSSTGATTEAAAPGITKTTIELGSIAARSGPLAVAGQTVDGGRAAIERVNAAGGVGGRKIELVSEDDTYDPAKALEKARKLIEKDGVFAMVGSVGTGPQLAVRDYVGSKKTPALFLFTGAGAWGEEHDKYPYSMTGVPSYLTEGRAFAEYLKTAKPDAKVAILYQNDDLGLDHIKGFEAGIAGTNIKIAEKIGYEVTDPAIAPLVTKAQRSGADVFMNIGSPQQVTQAIKQVGVLKWDALQLVPSAGASAPLLASVGKAAKGVVSDTWFKDPTTPQWKTDPDVVEYQTLMKQIAPKVDPNSRVPIGGYINMNQMIEALKAMKEPTQAALLSSAGNLDAAVPMLLPGVRAKTGSGDPLPIEQINLQRWTGDHFELVGDLIDASTSG
jgi:branched-chain amino acid transport system substrate-binding protein